VWMRVATRPPPGLRPIPTRWQCHATPDRQPRPQAEAVVAAWRLRSLRRFLAALRCRPCASSGWWCCCPPRPPRPSAYPLRAASARLTATLRPAARAAPASRGPPLRSPCARAVPASRGPPLRSPCARPAPASLSSSTEVRTHLPSGRPHPPSGSRNLATPPWACAHGVAPTVHPARSLAPPPRAARGSAPLDPWLRGLAALAALGTRPVLGAARV